MISTIDGVESCDLPEELEAHGAHRAAASGAARTCADVMRPSQPSFCTPGSPAEELVGHVLAEAGLAQRRALESRSVSLRSQRRAVGVEPASSNARPRASWILPRLWSGRVTSSHSASGVTIRHDARLSSAVPHSTAFLPPAFIATLPPMHEASADVGIDGEDKPRRFRGLHHALRDDARAAVDRRDRRVAARAERNALDRREAHRASRC